MYTNGCIEPRTQPVPNLQVLWCKPALNIPAAQIGIKSLSKFLVFAGTADETGVELKVVENLINSAVCRTTELFVASPDRVCLFHVQLDFHRYLCRIRIP